MNELPKGWEKVKIDNICLKPEQKKPDALEVFKYIDISSIDRSSKKITNPSEILGSEAPSRARKLVNENDIIVSMTRPNLNAVAKIPEDLDGQIASTGFDVLKPLLFEPDWLFAVVKSKQFIDTISGTTIGALYPACKASDIRNYKIPLPPLAEQKRIVEKLDEVLAQVDAIKTRLDNVPEILKRFRQSVLAAAVSGKLTEEWRKFFIEKTAVVKRYQDFKKKQLFQEISETKKNKIIAIHKVVENYEFKFTVPESWLLKNLNKVATSFVYGSSTKSSPAGDVPVLRMGNIQNGKLDWQDLVYSSNKKEIEKYNLQNGDVLFNRTNSPELVGKTSIYRSEHKAIYAGYLIKVQGTEILNSEFLNIALNSSHAKNYCMSVKTDGVSQSNINAQKLGNFPCPLPPIEEQEEIVRLVEQYFAFADTIEKQVSKAQAQVNNLTQSILKKAFSGKLVAQNPNDEPAEQLLAKIAKARKEAEAIEKAAKKIKK